MHLSDFPMRLDNAPGIALRTDNEIYKNEMKAFTTKIVNILKEAKTFKAWGGKNPYSTAKDLAFSIARFVQDGGVLNNYYMYYGGTNFGPNAGGPYITTSCDYKVPIDEYGKNDDGFARDYAKEECYIKVPER
ncbi:beta-galactosidase 9-like [Hevea brasiliensis]|uniref:beta-galactosidase 9-like n=1 Tax=Hevea brasiliensis TaxID=3981 RepID=UPI0025E3C6D3|nr:beta-galactosidase 9-like [Hevea brasiliensis]